jgi:hypothetical protein
VSGDSIAFSDPHQKYIDPDKKLFGIRIPLNHAKLYPEMYRSYSAFGNIFQKGSFPGTVFRFPLRSVDLAKESKIKPEPCSPENILDLFDHMRKGRGVLEECLLFLRHVRTVELYHIPKGERERIETPLNYMSPAFVVGVELEDGKIMDTRKEMLEVLRNPAKDRVFERRVNEVRLHRTTPGPQVTAQEWVVVQV